MQFDAPRIVFEKQFYGDLDAGHAISLRRSTIKLGDRLTDWFALLARQQFAQFVLVLS